MVLQQTIDSVTDKSKSNTTPIPQQYHTAVLCARYQYRRHDQIHATARDGAGSDSDATRSLTYTDIPSKVATGERGEKTIGRTKHDLNGKMEQ